MKEIRLLFDSDELEILRQAEAILCSISDTLCYEQSLYKDPKIKKEIEEEMYKLDSASELCWIYSICGETARYNNVRISVVPESGG